MLTRKAKVIRKEDDRVVLDIVRGEMCGYCSLLCGLNKNENIILEGHPDIKEGDSIEVGVKGENLIFLSVVSFLIPALLFMGIIVGIKDLVGPLFSFVYSLGSIVLYFTVLKLLVFNRMKKKLKCEVTKIL